MCAFPEDSGEAEGVRIIADQRMYEEKERHHRSGSNAFWQITLWAEKKEM